MRPVARGDVIRVIVRQLRSPRTVASPPWQSVQPSRTAGVRCMVGASDFTWQVLQPSDLAFISATDCRCGAGGAMTRE